MKTPTHTIRVTRRPVQREDAAPVVAHEHDVTQVEPGEPRLEIPGMIMLPICALRLARTSHPDEIGREATATIGDERQDVSPHVRHVRVDMVPGRNLRDRVAVAYARAGVPREVVMTVPSFTAAAAVVAASDLVATLPASLLAVRGTQLGLRALVAAVPTPAVEMALCWHERTHADPAAVAFRALVRRAVLDARARPA